MLSFCHNSPILSTRKIMELALCKDIYFNNIKITINNAIEYKAIDQLNQYLLLNVKSPKDFPNMHLLLENMARY